MLNSSTQFLSDPKVHWQHPNCNPQLLKWKTKTELSTHVIILQTHCHFNDVLGQAWGRISTSGGHNVSAPSLDSVVIRSGNAYDSDAKKLRNMIHNDCVFLTPNGLSAELRRVKNNVTGQSGNRRDHTHWTAVL